MVNFAQAQYLILLLLLPLFFAAYAVMRHLRTRRLARLGDKALVSELMPSVSSSKGWIRLTLFSLAFFFFVIAVLSVMSMADNHLFHIFPTLVYSMLIALCEKDSESVQDKKEVAKHEECERSPQDSGVCRRIIIFETH